MFRSECAGNYSRRTAQKGEMGMATAEKKMLETKKAGLSINLAELPPDLAKKKKLFVCVNVSNRGLAWMEGGTARGHPMMIESYCW